MMEEQKSQESMYSRVFLRLLEAFQKLKLAWLAYVVWMLDTRVLSLQALCSKNIDGLVYFFSGPGKPEMLILGQH